MLMLMVVLCCIHNSPHLLVLVPVSSRLLFFGCSLLLQCLFILKQNSLCPRLDLDLVRSLVAFSELQ